MTHEFTKPGTIMVRVAQDFGAEIQLGPNSDLERIAWDWTEFEPVRYSAQTDAVPAQLPAVIDPPAEVELGFSATTLKALLIERAQVDREQTVQAMVQALAELDVIRPVRSASVYNHQLIGAHEHNRQEIADQIGRFLYANGVIEFAQRPDVAGGRGMTNLTGEVWVMIPKRMQGVDPAEGTEVPN